MIELDDARPETRNSSVEKLDSTVTHDAFLGGKLILAQPKNGYRAGIDAVLLACAVPAKPGETVRVLDCGAGVGTVGLCIARRNQAAQVVMVEREPANIALAEQNITANHLSERVETVQADIVNPDLGIVKQRLGESSFTHVVANPPFYRTGHGTSSPAQLKAAGHEMPEHDFERWIRFMARMATPNGRLVMIKPASALPGCLQSLAGRFGSIEVVPLHSHAGKDARRVVISARKGSRAGFKLLPGLVLHRADNSYTTDVQNALMTGAALDFFE